MRWIKKLLGWGENHEDFGDGEPIKGESGEIVVIDEAGPQEPKKEKVEVVDTRTILKDHVGEDLVCSLCSNQDNETGKYFPIRAGDKIKFDGKTWHTKCLRVFKKSARAGDLF